MSDREVKLNLENTSEQVINPATEVTAQAILTIALSIKALLTP